MAREGLRTLVVAKRVLTEEQYQDFEVSGDPHPRPPPLGGRPRERALPARARGRWCGVRPTCVRRLSARSLSRLHASPCAASVWQCSISVPSTHSGQGCLHTWDTHTRTQPSLCPQSRYTQAKLSVHDRTLKVAAVVESLEREMQLLCVTGVEDRLQADVRPTLEMLRNAGIKVQRGQSPARWHRPGDAGPGDAGPGDCRARRHSAVTQGPITHGPVVWCWVTWGRVTAELGDL